MMCPAMHAGHPQSQNGWKATSGDLFGEDNFAGLVYPPHSPTIKMIVYELIDLHSAWKELYYHVISQKTVGVYPPAIQHG